MSYGSGRDGYLSFFLLTFFLLGVSFIALQQFFLQLNRRGFFYEVKADASAFTPLSGNSIPASLVSWTTSNASNGTGSSGTLSDTTWGLVFTSTTLPVTGSVGLTFTLASPGAGIHAGAHTLTMQWKIEAF